MDTARTMAIAKWTAVQSRQAPGDQMDKGGVQMAPVFRVARTQGRFR